MTKTALEFSIAGARLALDLAHVVEVLPAVSLVKPPETPPLLRGFVNVEGRMIPLLRLERLLRLQVRDQVWNPEEDLSSMIVLAEVDEIVLGWMVMGDARMISYDRTETVKLPSQHVLNNCAEWVIARKPPEPSIVLLEMNRLLLEKERVMIAELRDREEARLREVDADFLSVE